MEDNTKLRISSQYMANSLHRTAKYIKQITVTHAQSLIRVDLTAAARAAEAFAHKSLIS